MVDQIIDDVKMLLDKEYGDKRILEQILRAVQNNEVISNYERNYVRKLTEKHLNRKPAVQEKKTTPDVILPEEPSVAQTEVIESPEPASKTTISKSKIMLGIGGLVIAIVIVAGASLSGILDIPSEDEVVTPPLQPNSILTLQTDLPSYSKADLISISGKSDTGLGGEVSVSIENENGTLVWSENLKIKPDGRFTTLVIAGGDGWEPGTFTVKATHGEESQSTTFTFAG